MNNKIRIGIIGAGAASWASRTHIPAIQLIPEFELTAVSTSNQESADEAALKYGIRYAFDNAFDLVNCPDVDLVVVAVKVPHHYSLVKEAIKAGKMIFCEWPLGNGLKEAEHLADFATRFGVRNFVGLQSLSLPETVYLRKFISEGNIGEVISSSILASAGGWSSARSENDLYLLDPANGATMLEIPFAHTVAAFNNVLGQFKSLSATLVRRRREVPLLSAGIMVPQLSNDQIMVSGTLASGAAVNLHYRAGLSAGTNFLWEINGSRGDIMITGQLGHYQLTPVKVQFAATGEILQPLLITSDEELKEIPDQPVRGIYLAYLQILSDIRNNECTAPGFHEGVQLHRLLASIQKSDKEMRLLSLL